MSGEFFFTLLFIFIFKFIFKAKTRRLLWQKKNQEQKTFTLSCFESDIQQYIVRRKKSELEICMNFFNLIIIENKGTEIILSHEGAISDSRGDYFPRVNSFALKINLKMKIKIIFKS